MALARKSAGSKSSRSVPTANRRRTRIYQSTRAGLVLPIPYFLRVLRMGNYAKQIEMDAAVYLAAVLEYLMSEILDLAGKACYEDRKLRINSKHIDKARDDEQLARVFLE